MTTHTSKTILILGDFLHEGITTAVSTLGLEHQKHTLHRVQPATWIKRAELLKDLRESGQLAGVIVYLPTPVLLHGCEETFETAWDILLDELKKNRSIIFLFERNLTYDFEYRDPKDGRTLTTEEIREKIEELRAEAREYQAIRLELTLDQILRAAKHREHLERYLTKILASGVEIAPFRSRAEVTVRVQEFLDELEGGVFLRLYIPHGRLQSEQLTSFLRTFERYLTQIEKRSFSIDTRKTDLGILYLFKAGELLSSPRELENALARFDSFMSLCRDNPAEAINILEHDGIKHSEAAFIIARYSKEYQRLILDARHETEHKILLLRQQLENEIFESIAGEISSIKDRDKPSTILWLVGNTGPINLSLQGDATQPVNLARSTIGSIVDGGIQYTEQEEKLLQIFQKSDNKLEATQLRSDLDQLKDHSSPDAAKMTARQRITGFLYKTATKAADKGADLGIKFLVAYLDKLMNTGN